MNKEHLSASVEAGTIEKLQIFAGGPRKVGEFLSELVDLLWQHRDIVEGTDPKGLIIAVPDHDLARKVERLEREVNAIKWRLEGDDA